MKLILVHNSYQQPGGEDIAFEQERQLLERTGHSVVTYRRSNEEVEAYAGLARISLAARTIWNGDARREFAALLKRETPELVLVHNTFVMISPSIYWACRDASVPVVQTLHNYRLLCPAGNLFRSGRVCEKCVEHGLLSSVRDACYRGSRMATATSALLLAVHRRCDTWTEMVDAFIATSEFARQKFVAAGIPAEKIHVKPNFVDPDPGRRHRSRDSALFVGRLSEEKGVRTLLAAWERLKDPIPLRIVGDGPLRGELMAQAAQRSLFHVTFEGRLTHQETLLAMQQARFVIVPSQCYENFPVTVAEAFACGTPVLCSHLGALPEIVAEHRTGLHFSPGDPDDLAAHVEWSWTHPARMAEMGVAARDEYQNRYTAERNYAILMEICAQALRRWPAHLSRRTSSANNGIPSFRLLGVRVDAVQISDAIAQMVRWIEERSRCNFVAVTGMHGVTEAQHEAEFKRILLAADMVVPDGMPLVWLGRRKGHPLQRRVYGPELMQTFCQVTGPKFRHYFYGGAPGVPERLAEILEQRYAVTVAGTHSPPFRPLTPEEDEEVIEQIHRSAPDIIWVGLSTPKQERWMYAHRERLRVPVLVGVGAAFDLNSERVRQAPAWMRESGLEWLFRLLQEPRRLWRRYLIYGSQFICNVSLELLGLRKFQ